MASEQGPPVSGPPPPNEFSSDTATVGREWDLRLRSQLNWAAPQGRWRAHAARDVGQGGGGLPGLPGPAGAGTEPGLTAHGGLAFLAQPIPPARLGLRGSRPPCFQVAWCVEAAAAQAPLRVGVAGEHALLIPPSIVTPPSHR